MTRSTSTILGIESSCDETAAAVVTNGSLVLSNIIASQHNLHEKFGGVVPEVASRAHIEKILPVIEQALSEANTTLDQIDAIAIGNRPGLIGSLLVGLSAAKALAWSLQIPLIGIDHVHAHLYAGALDESPPEYPALGLVASGGHSSVYAVDSPHDIKLLGKTIDDAIGEAYDKVASILQLGYPGGPIVDKRAQNTPQPKNLRFPRTMLEPDSLDFSFSGIKTAVLYHVRGNPQGRGRDRTFPRDASDLTEEQITETCAAFQHAAVDTVIKKLDRALTLTQNSDTPYRTLLVGGGVSANSLLRQSTTEFAQANNLQIRLPRMAYCLDNAAMIAGLAHHKFISNEFDTFDLPAVATSAL